MNPRPHLAFVGIAGVGKSTIAAAVAKAAGRELVDLDKLIVANEASAIRREREGEVGGVTRLSSVSAIFARHGEEGFRDREAGALLDVTERERPTVIATGGGIVERASNRDLLARRCVVVWLSAPEEVVVDRLGRSRTRRPLLRGDAASKLHELIERRESLYREVADVHIDLDGAGRQRSVDIVLGELRRRGLLP
ncbi:MAG: shikimate kinase [Microthrixaceae bacterium]